MVGPTNPPAASGEGARPELPPAASGVELKLPVRARPCTRLSPLTLMGARMGGTAGGPQAPLPVGLLRFSEPRPASESSDMALRAVGIRKNSYHNTVTHAACEKQRQRKQQAQRGAMKRLDFGQTPMPRCGAQTTPPLPKQGSHLN